MKMLSCRQHELESVKLLLRYNANINQLDPNGQTALIFAIWFDHREIAKLLISAGAACNHAKPDGWTALMLACEKGQLDVVDCLIKAGAKLNIATNENVTALCVACTNGHVAVVKRLLDAGAYKAPDSSAAFFKKWLNPRDFAVQEGHQEVVDLLDEYLRNQSSAQTSQKGLSRTSE